MNMLQLAASATKELMRELRQGTKDVCSDSESGIQQAVTIKLYKQAPKLSNESLLVATVTDYLSKEIHYVNVSELTNDSLVLFQVDLWNISETSELQGRLSQSNGRSMKVKNTLFIVADSEKVYILGNEEKVHDYNHFGYVIGNVWLANHLDRFIAKGKRTQWTIKADKDVQGGTSYIFDYGKAK